MTSNIIHRYNGGRKADDFIRFIRSRSVITFNKDIFMRPVIELDESNFERIMKDRTKNIMVLYYNGHCKLCQQMEYSYHQVGLTFSNEPDCVLSRLDCDAQASICLHQLIPHYPTVRVSFDIIKRGFMVVTRKVG
jgi:protein disulfide-isomerase A6